MEGKVWAFNGSEQAFPHTEYSTEEHLLEKGIRIFKSIFDDIKDGEHIVPLSGGLDSRAILGALLHKGLRGNITAVTYGTPGTWDYEIGKLVAKSLEINHVSIDLNDIPLDTQSLLEMARRDGLRAWLFDCFYNRLIPERFGKDVVYWSGFMGDPLSGSHLLATDSCTWEKAVLQSIERNSFVRSVDIANPNFDARSALPQLPLLKDSVLSYDEQIDFAIRQESYIRRIVIVDEYDYRTPFLQPEWVEFILSVPRRYRKKQFLYRQILNRAFPHLSSLPTKANYGLPLNIANWKLNLRRGFWAIKNAVGNRFAFCAPTPHLAVNYIDFDEAIRQRKDLEELVAENIGDLKRRGILDWIDVEDLWVRHQERSINCADALTLLVSLEIILKACAEE